MTTLFKYVQSQNFSLAGAGAIAGATSVTLKSFKGIDGITNLTMTDFGAIGFGTLEPGNGTQEEQISFTGITQNSSGTATLTGVNTVLFINPYTATSGLVKTHAGSTTFVVSNTAGFYDKFPAKANDETITGQWTFSVFPITPSNSDASTTVKGVTKLSTAPVSPTNPIAVGDNDTRIPVAYAVDAVGTDAYAITPSPAITAYVAGQFFTFKAGTLNTGAATLNVSGLGAKTIKKDVSSDLVTGDILANQVVEVIYDGTNMQLVSRSSTLTPLNPTVQVVTATGTYTAPAGLKYALVELVGGGGGGGSLQSTSRVGGGGGGGGYARKILSAATIGVSQSVTIGAGGASATSAGGTTSFGALLSATGGALGANGAAAGAAGGAGGIGSSGDINIRGGAGGNGGGSTNDVSLQGTIGGSSVFGGGGITTGGQYGGGGGGQGNNIGGGDGFAGVVIVTEYYA